MKRFAKSFALIVASMMLVTGAHAADPAKLPPAANKVVVTVPGPVVLQAATCPNPYDKYTQGVDQTLGEYYCVKANIGCPQGFTGDMNQQTGKMTCTPIITATCPAGWSGGVVAGQLVCNSIPQPMVSCKYTDNGGGTSYYKESWNKMGCSYRIIPK